MTSRILIAVCLMVAFTHAQDGQKKTFTSPGGAQLRVLVDASSLEGS